MRSWRGVFLWSGLLLVLACPRAWAGGFYLHPILGAAMPVDDRGKVAVSAGAAGGYHFGEYLALETNYSYLYHPDYRGHLLRTGPVLSYSLDIVTPYITAGAGFHKLRRNGVSQDYNVLFDLGGGLQFDPPGPVNFTLGVSYDLLRDNPDFLTPYLAFSLGF